jgi:anthranilate phosphoribosyltransferase
MIDELRKVTDNIDLSSAEADGVMRKIMGATASEAEMAAMLIALKMKGESPQEIAAMAKVMRDFAVRIEPKVAGTLVDVCGTGGDTLGTFNISTAAMFIVAAAGVPVAKHGNRGISSKSGSADVLEALGARIELPPKRICASIEKIGLGFMFAPNHHPAMKHVMPVRRQLKVRTVFNILGPLTNPAGANAQLMGVYDPMLTEKLAEVLGILGRHRAFVVCGHPHMDEVSTLGPTRISELSSARVRTYDFHPASLGISTANLSDLAGATAEQNAKTIKDIFSGDIKGPRRDIVLLNAAYGIVVGGKESELSRAFSLAAKMVDSGRAQDKLKEFVDFTGLSYDVLA